MVLTDNETWFGDIHPVEALRQYRAKMGIPARLLVRIEWLCTCYRRTASRMLAVLAAGKPGRGRVCRTAACCLLVVYD